VKKIVNAPKVTHDSNLINISRGFLVDDKLTWKFGKYERDFMNWKLIEENCFCGVRKWQPKKKEHSFYDPLENRVSFFIQ
jgi:hypothetical protein